MIRPKEILLLALVCALLTINCVGADATGLAPGVYTVGTDGKFHPVTNVDLTALWPGIWKEDTNGLRVQLSIITNGSPTLLRVGVGSIRFNSLGGYIGSPNGKFEKCELQDSNGVVVPFLKGMELESHLPARISLKDFPRWPNGGLKNHVAFFTNDAPFNLATINFNDVYRIKKEGDYLLRVCSAIYKFGTNADYLDRIDLPCVNAKIHLKPSE